MRKPSRAGARYAPAQRLDILRAALVARRMTYAEIQELLEASRSTAKRLLAVSSARRMAVWSGGCG